MKDYFIIKVKDKKQYILNIYNEHTDDISCTFTSFLNKAKRWKEEDTVKYLVFKLVFKLDRIELEYLKKKFSENKPEKIENKINKKEELLLLDEEPIKKEIKKNKKKKSKKPIIKKIEIKPEPVVVAEQEPVKKENVLSSIKGLISKKIKKIQEEIKYYY